MPHLSPVFLPDFLRHSASRFPTRIAIDFLGAKTSYAQLWQQAQSLAAGLQAKGLRKGDRVALMLPNCPAYLQFFNAVHLAGGIVVNVNPLYSPHELAHIINDSDPNFIVTLDLLQMTEKLKPLLAGRRLIIAPMSQQLGTVKGIAFGLLKRKEITREFPDKTIFYKELFAPVERLRMPDIDLEKDVAVLQYTGGTTGLSKAAMLSHANLSINAKQCRAWMPDTVEGQETALAVIPFFHVFALTTLVNLSMLIGTTIIALPQFVLKDVLKNIHKKKPTIFPAVPTIYTAINNAKDIGKYDLRSINYCVSGGAPLPTEVKQKFEQLTGCTLVEGYGLSETSPVVSCNPIKGVNKAGSIGIPFPETHVEIISLEDRETVLPIGERGELCVRGPQVMLGYWNQPLETAEAMKGGRFHTGDVAMIDEDGYIFIVDRIKDLILSGGYNVYPRHIEEAAYRHQSIEECVAAGIKDDYRGETIKLWIKLKPGHKLSADELKIFLKEYLSPIEMPKQFEFRDMPLPKTLIGKLSRKALVEEEEAKAAKEKTS